MTARPPSPNVVSRVPSGWSRSTAAWPTDPPTRMRPSGWTSTASTVPLPAPSNPPAALALARKALSTAPAAVSLNTRTSPGKPSG